MEFRKEDQFSEEIELLVRNVIGAAIEVHRELGPGYLEKIYEQAMLIELNHRGIACATQVVIPVYFKGKQLHGHVLDMLVEGKVILELKSVESLLPIHTAQILSYLKSTGLRVGLLINFNKRLLKDGIKRLVRKNDYSCTLNQPFPLGL